MTEFSDAMRDFFDRASQDLRFQQGMRFCRGPQEDRKKLTAKKDPTP